jgi:hypothetical protein
MILSDAVKFPEFVYPLFSLASLLLLFLLPPTRHVRPGSGSRIIMMLSIPAVDLAWAWLGLP